MSSAEDQQYYKDVKDMEAWFKVCLINRRAGASTPNLITHFAVASLQRLDQAIHCRTGRFKAWNLPPDLSF